MQKKIMIKKNALTEHKATGAKIERLIKHRMMVSPVNEQQSIASAVKVYARPELVIHYGLFIS